VDWLRGLGGNDTLYGNVDSDLVEGGEGADQLYGGIGEDVLRGESGDDGLWGWEGGDLLLGGVDVDRLFGEAGDDRLVGGAGDDLMNGGAGLDVASWLDDGVAAGIAADLALGTAERGVSETDRLVDIEHLEGTAFADTLRGDASSNRLDGAGGADRLFGLGGDDLLIGSLGSDELDGGSGDADRVSYEALGTGVAVRLADGTATKGLEADTLTGIEHVTGSSFADTLRGDAGANELHGLDGADLLAGGLGTDALNGGWGGDVFGFGAVAESAAGPARDVISDFTASVDRIDLTAIDAVADTVGADDAFTFIDNAAFSGAGELRFWFDGDRTILQANTGGTLDPELAIELTGIQMLAAEDFVL
jgi:Ca2+-binding RTX toxin-like protein